MKLNCKYYKIKSRNLKNSIKEYVIELKTSQEKGLMEQLSELDGLNGLSLLAHDGEVTY